MVDFRGVDYEGARGWVSVEGTALTPGPSPTGGEGSGFRHSWTGGPQDDPSTGSGRTGAAGGYGPHPRPLSQEGRGERGVDSDMAGQAGLRMILPQAQDERGRRVGTALTPGPSPGGRGGVDTKVTRRRGVWPLPFLRFCPLPIPAATCGFHGGRWLR